MMRWGLSLVVAIASAAMSFGQNFQLPVPPSTVTDIPQRAAYVVSHYWDNADLAALSASDLEQAFVNYLSVFPLTESDSTCAASASALLHRADSLGGNAAETMLSLAEKYLFNGDSPMVQEEYFSGFVSAAAGCRNISSYQRDRLQFWNMVTGSNRKGNEIAKFRFRSSEGRLMSFDQIKGKRLLLLFDPVCKDCLKMIESLSGMELDCTVVAIALNCTKERFRAFAAALPDSWIKGWDSTGTVNGGAFLIRHFPDLYLVDGSGIILEKHSAALPQNGRRI